MIKFKNPKPRDFILISLGLIVLTQLIGEYILSREVNGWIQLLSVIVWIVVVIKTLIMGWKIFKNKFE